MTPSQACENLIKSFESCRLKAYRDIRGILTIGWGHTGPEVTEALEITQPWADYLLLEDTGKAVVKLRSRIGNVDLKQGQFDALVSFCYNVELKEGEECHLLEYVRDGDMAAAAAEFPRWCHSAGKVVAGLVRRRAAEQRMFQAA